MLQPVGLLCCEEAERIRKRYGFPVTNLYIEIFWNDSVTCCYYGSSTIMTIISFSLYSLHLDIYIYIKKYYI